MELSEIEKRIIELIDESHFDEIIEALRKYKIDGGSQSDAYSLLEKVMISKREQKDEKSEDLLLEIMDIVSGFCLPDKKIWESDLK